ncbi:MAG: SDR family oxidoreductase [Planctomycetota bacterium]
MEGLYLVTGGGGFIGANTVAGLLERGAAVRVLDNFATGRRANLAGLEGPRLEIIEGDIRSLDAGMRAMRGVTHVIHLAALGSIPRSIEDPLTTHEVNTGGTLNLLQAARAAGVRRFVYGGSSSSYGDNRAIPKHETHLGRPLSPYAISKFAGELYCRSFHDLFGLPAVCLRYFNVFGPLQDPDSAYAAVIPRFFKHCLRNEPPVINGDGEQTRDFTFVGNAVAANIRACAAGPASLGRVFNIAGGRRITVNRLCDEVRRLTGAAVTPVHAPERPGDIRHSEAAIDAAAEGLGYRPETDVFAGLELSAAWYRRMIAVSR